VLHRWCADIDDVKIGVGDQLAEVSVGLGDVMLFGKIDDVGSACSDCADLRLNPINAFIRIHMQVGDEPASYETYSHFWHPVLLKMALRVGQSASLP
jgi:hypothetical protein